MPRRRSDARHAALDDAALVELARRQRRGGGADAGPPPQPAALPRGARRVRDDAEAEDVVQETYVRAFTHLSSFRGEAALATWLTRIALNEALGRLRRRRPRADLAEIENVGPDDRRIIAFPAAGACQPRGRSGAGPGPRVARARCRRAARRSCGSSSSCATSRA